MNTNTKVETRGRPTKITPVMEELVVTLRQKGRKGRELQWITGWSQPTIQKILKRHGLVKIRVLEAA